MQEIITGQCKNMLHNSCFFILILENVHLLNNIFYIKSITSGEIVINWKNLVHNEPESFKMD